jgi:hypothetical protein
MNNRSAMKRTWAILLVLLLFSATAVVQAQCTYSTNTDGSIYAYSTNADGSISIDAYTGPPWAVAVPTSINGLTVTGIGNGLQPVFSTNLTFVTIPGSVTSLAKNAFFFCTNLANVTIPDSVTNIGIEAFCECRSLTNAAIGNGVTRIGNSAFRNCHRLEGVYFKGNAPSLGLIPAFYHDLNAVVYYLPDTKGWGPTFAGCPTEMWKP